jgi:hypothetical protein
MELTFKTDIGSFLKSENKSSEGWTIMDIYDNTKIIIYVKKIRKIHWDNSFLLTPKIRLECTLTLIF